MRNVVKYNRFDYVIILILGMLSFGNLGGAATPLRIIAIPLFIFLLFSSVVRIRKGLLADMHLFLLAFFCWVVISFGWSIDYQQAVKDAIYFFIHAVVLLVVVHAAGKAVNPIRSVCLGWMIAVAFTLPVAMVEIVFDWHLAVSISEAGTVINYGEGRVAQKTFASATYGNWNAYVTFLCFSLPFLIGSAYFNRLILLKYFSVFVVFSVGIIVAVNASRGGVIAYCLITALAILNHLRSGRRSKLPVLLSVLLMAGLVIWFGYDVLSYQLLARLDSVSLLGHHQIRWVTICLQPLPA